MDKECRKEYKNQVLLYYQVCLHYERAGEQEPEKGIQYTFVFLFPMQPQLQNFKSFEKSNFPQD